MHCTFYCWLDSSVLLLNNGWRAWRLNPRTLDLSHRTVKVCVAGSPPSKLVANFLWWFNGNRMTRTYLERISDESKLCAHKSTQDCSRLHPNKYLCIYWFFFFFQGHFSCRKCVCNCNSYGWNVGKRIRTNRFSSHTIMFLTNMYRLNAAVSIKAVGQQCLLAFDLN